MHNPARTMLLVQALEAELRESLADGVDATLVQNAAIAALKAGIATLGATETKRPTQNVSFILAETERLAPTMLAA